jgi:superfamily II DNA or RNA helicase
MNRAELVGDIVRTWQEEAEDRPTLCFAVNIAHSQAICQDFQAAGVAAAHLDAYTPREVRKETIAAFRAGELRVLSSVNVLGIGFDVPDAACAVLARPTLSEALHMQQMGRVIRPAPDKAGALILDHAGNTVRFGLPQHFEVPDLGTHATSTRSKRNEQRLVTCPACGAVLEPEQRTCPGCGITRAPRTTRVGVAPGELVLHDGSAPAQETYSEAERFNWYAALLGHAKRLNFKPGWAFFAYQAKFGAKPPWAWRSARPREPDREQKRWIRRYYKDSKRNAAAHKSAL